jgi:hypothetical protein
MSAASSAFRGRIGLLVSLAITALWSASPARGEMIISINPVTINASPGSSGTFEVDLQNTGPVTVNIEGFGFEINSATPNIVFTGAFTSTTAYTYIFNGNSYNGPEIDTLTGQILDASDNSINPSGFNLVSGGTVGLGEINYTVGTGTAAGSYGITFTTTGGATSLNDSNFNNISIDQYDGGTIDVSSGPVAVPAPPSVVLMGVALGCWAALRLIPGLRLRRVLAAG